MTRSITKRGTILRSIISFSSFAKYARFMICHSCSFTRIPKSNGKCILHSVLCSRVSSHKLAPSKKCAKRGLLVFATFLRLREKQHTSSRNSVMGCLRAGSRLTNTIYSMEWERKYPRLSRGRSLVRVSARPRGLEQPRSALLRSSLSFYCILRKYAISVRRVTSLAIMDVSLITSTF